MKDFGQHHRQIKFNLTNGLWDDEAAIASLMRYREYSRDTAERCLRGIKNAIEKDRQKQKEKDMRTKINRAKVKETATVLSLEEIKRNYEDRGRLLKGEAERLFELCEMNESEEITHPETSPLDGIKCPEQDVLEGFDNEQVVTLGVTLGLWMIMLVEKNLPEHSLIKRKERLKDAERAILALVHGLGKDISEESLNYWCSVWNLTWNMAMDKIKNDHNIEVESHDEK